MSRYRVHKLGYRVMKTCSGMSIQITQGHIIERKVGNDWVYVTQTHPDSVESLLKNLEKQDNED